MKRIIAAAVIAASSVTVAHAQDWFQFEAGIGASHISDLGDGTWIQEGARSNHEEKNTVAIMGGLTGPIYTHGAVDVRWHADYVYLGSYSASVLGVPDNQYNATTHSIVNYAGERFSPFNGQGHTQGVPLTLDIGYTYRGWRIGAEAGMWAYVQTWHESLYTLGDEWVNMRSPGKVQLGYVVGASVARGPLAISYRYYQIREDWSNGTPGLARAAQVIMATYRF